MRVILTASADEFLLGHGNKIAKTVNGDCRFVKAGSPKSWTVKMLHPISSRRVATIAIHRRPRRERGPSLICEDGSLVQSSRLWRAPYVVLISFVLLFSKSLRLVFF